MASASGQNFLRLLFGGPTGQGGLQGGVDNFFQQKQRGQDLALNLHQMKARQANADRAFDFNVEGRAENTRRYEQGVARQSAIDSAAEARQGNLDVSNNTQQLISNFRNKFADQRTQETHVARMGEFRARAQSTANLVSNINSNEAFSPQQRALLTAGVNGAKIPATVMNQAFATGNETADAVMKSVLSRFGTGMPTEQGDIDQLMETVQNVQTRFADQSPQDTPQGAIAGPEALSTQEKVYESFSKPGILRSKEDAIALMADESLWEPGESDADRLRYLLGEGKVKKAWFGSIMSALSQFRSGDGSHDELLSTLFPDPPKSKPGPKMRRGSTRSASPNPVGIPVEL